MSNALQGRLRGTLRHPLRLWGAVLRQGAHVTLATPQPRLPSHVCVWVVPSVTGPAELWDVPEDAVEWEGEHLEVAHP